MFVRQRHVFVCNLYTHVVGKAASHHHFMCCFLIAFKLTKRGEGEEEQHDGQHKEKGRESAVHDVRGICMCMYLWWCVFLWMMSTKLWTRGAWFDDDTFIQCVSQFHGRRERRGGVGVGWEERMLGVGGGYCSFSN